MPGRLTGVEVRRSSASERRGDVHGIPFDEQLWTFLEKMRTEMPNQIGHVRRFGRRRWRCVGGGGGDEGGKGERVCALVSKEQFEAAAELDFEIDRGHVCVGGRERARRNGASHIGQEHITDDKSHDGIARCGAYGVAGYHIRLAWC